MTGAERQLQQQICDRLHAQAFAGQRFAGIDLSHLVGEPAIRWGYCWDGGGEHRTDRVRPGDDLVIGSALRQRGLAQRWAAYYRRSPDSVTVARDGAGNPVGHVIALIPGTAAHDPLGAACLDLAERLEHVGGAALDRAEPALHPRSRSSAATNARASLETVGAERVSGMIQEFDDHWVDCHLPDYGTGRAVGDAARRGLPRARRWRPATAYSIVDRAESVRAALREAADSAFGASEREVLTRRYFEPAQQHEATHFRRLREAVTRVADYLVTTRVP